VVQNVMVTSNKKYKAMRKASIESVQPAQVQAFDRMIEDLMTKEEVTLPIGYCVDDIEILAEAIHNVSGLKKLIFIGELGDEPTQKTSFVNQDQFTTLWKAIMEGQSSIQCLGFISMHLTDDHLNLLVKFAMACLDKISPTNTSLSSLILCGNDFSVEGKKSLLFELTQPQTQLFSSLKELDLGANIEETPSADLAELETKFESLSVSRTNKIE